MGEIATVVPFRLGGLTRLAPVLSTEDRQRLAGAMLSDVIAAVRGAGIEPIVAAADAQTGDSVRRDWPDVACIVDLPGRDLDASVAAHAAGHPDGLLVVMADLPALRPEDVWEVMALDAAVVVAETADGGTGALLRRPSHVIETSYGPGSAIRHETLASRSGVACTRVQLPGFLFEIDHPGDLERAPRKPIGTATSHVLG